jgi:hypothetical protein
MFVDVTQHAALTDDAAPRKRGAAMGLRPQSAAGVTENGMSNYATTGQKSPGTTLSNRQHNILREHAVRLDDRVPAAGGPFTFASGPDSVPTVELPTRLQKRLRANSLVARVDRVRVNNGSPCSIVEMPAGIRRRLREMAAQTDSPCGCGHSGVSNLGDGWFSCARDYCDVRVRREEVDL